MLALNVSLAAEKKWLPAAQLHQKMPNITKGYGRGGRRQVPKIALKNLKLSASPARTGILTVKCQTTLATTMPTTKTPIGTKWENSRWRTTVNAAAAMMIAPIKRPAV